VPPDCAAGRKDPRAVSAVIAARRTLLPAFDRTVASSQFVPTQVASPRASDDGEKTAISRRFAEPEMCEGDEVLVRYAGRY
jgi:hypothetical protein